MINYTLRVAGLDRNTHVPRTVENTFDAVDDEGAIAHVDTALLTTIDAELEQCEAGDLRRTDSNTVAVRNMRTGAWLLGDIPPDNRPVYRGYSRAELKVALDLIKDPTNWKMPFDTYVPADADRALIEAAAAFYSGSPVIFTEVKTRLHVSGPGYYACIGS